jgi:hypothetical protein
MSAAAKAVGAKSAFKAKAVTSSRPLSAHPADRVDRLPAPTLAARFPRGQAIPRLRPVTFRRRHLTTTATTVLITDLTTGADMGTDMDMGTGAGECAQAVPETAAQTS